MIIFTVHTTDKIVIVYDMPRKATRNNLISPVQRLNYNIS